MSGIFFLRWWKIGSFSLLLLYPLLFWQIIHNRGGKCQKPWKVVMPVNFLQDSWSESTLKVCEWPVYALPWLRKRAKQEDNRKKHPLFLSESTWEVWIWPQPESQPASLPTRRPIQNMRLSKDLQMGRSRWKVPDDKHLFKLHLEFHLSNCLSATTSNAK